MERQENGDILITNEEVENAVKYGFYVSAGLFVLGVLRNLVWPPVIRIRDERQ